MCNLIKSHIYSMEKGTWFKEEIFHCVCRHMKFNSRTAVKKAGCDQLICDPNGNDCTGWIPVITDRLGNYGYNARRFGWIPKKRPKI